MRVHIYIRKQNEHYWNTIRDKSEWLNDILDQERREREEAEELIFKRKLDEIN